jgi:hypothetical protein
MKSLRWIPLAAFCLAGCLQPENPSVAGPSGDTADSAGLRYSAMVKITSCVTNPSAFCPERPCAACGPFDAPSGWSPFTEGAFELAANTATEVFGLDYRGSVAGGYPLRRYSGEGPGQLIPAGLVAMDMQGGALWGVNNAGWIFRHFQPVTGTAWRHIGFTYNGRYGFLARAVASSPEGNVFVLSTETVAGGHKLYKYSGYADVWNLIAGGLVQIDVDNNGTLWGVNGAGWVFRHHAPVTGTAWQHVGFKVDGVSGYLARGISVGNGIVLVFTNETAPGGYKVYRYSGTGDAWTPFAQGLATLSVNPEGLVFGANLNQQAFKKDP